MKPDPIVKICIKPNDDDDRPLAEICIYINDKMINSAMIGGEPEDNSYTRDYAWIAPMLQNLAKQLGADVEIIEIDQNVIDEIYNMSHHEMANMWRFKSSNSMYIKYPYFKIFEKRFKELGGMTPEISKQIGWG